MKLYATLNSDKARKAQGGNKYIQITLSVAEGKGSAEDSILIANGVLERESGGYKIYISTIGTEADQCIDQFISDSEVLKVKKQKTA